MGEAGGAQHPERTPACRRPEDLSARALLSRALGLYRRGWPALWRLAGALALPAAALDALARAAALGPLEALQLQGAAGLLVGVVAAVASARVLVVAAEGGAPAAGEALLFAVRRWPAAVSVFYLASLVVSLGLVLLVVPGIVAGLNLCLALPLLAATRLDANRALRRARDLVHGARLRLAGPLLLVAALTGAPSLAAGGLPDLAAAHLPKALAPTAAALVAWGSHTGVGLLDAGLAAVLVAAYQTLASRGDATLRGPGRPPA